ncbi:MAG: GDSL-type esterase/lipase family protein [Nibricoccus sp.]
MKPLLAFFALLGALGLTRGETIDPYTSKPHVDFHIFGSGKTQLLVVGDSRLRNSSQDFWNSTFGSTGWGECLGKVEALKSYRIVNCGIGGTSLRSYINRGYWNRVLALVKTEDIVIFYFAGNDLRPIEDQKRSCGELHGLGDKSTTIYNPYLKCDETVLTYGAYYNRVISEVKKAGAIPYICTYFSGQLWKDGQHQPGPSHMVNAWIHLIATENQVKLVDLYTLMERELAVRGEKKSAELFVKDGFHTSSKGALLVANLIGDIVSNNRFTEPVPPQP